MKRTNKTSKTPSLLGIHILIAAVLLAGCSNNVPGENQSQQSTPAPSSGEESETAESPEAGTNPTETDTPLHQDSQTLQSKYEETFANQQKNVSYMEDYEGNPIMTQRFGADPYALVYDDTLYIYMTGDVFEYENGGSDVAPNSYSKVNTIGILSTRDMVNWTDCGSVYAAGTYGAATWAKNSWAPAAAYKEIDGEDQFFLYFANNAGGIAVLTSDSPTGPFKDPLGEPLISRATPNCSDVTWLFDPAVLMDDDGSAYLYFGGGIPGEEYANPGTARVVKLGEDMISLAEDPITLADIPYLFEDSGINKIGDTYCYSYSSNWNVDSTYTAETGIGSAHIVYMTSDSPAGPFTNAQSILKNPGSFFGFYGNNHHCIFQFRDKWYIAYHSQVLENRMGVSGGYRCTHIDSITVKEDTGEIFPASGTLTGVSAIATLNPYNTVEAETFARMAGLDTTPCGIMADMYGSGNMAVCDIHSGDWCVLENVDFSADGKSAKSFTATIRTKQGQSGVIRLALDSLDGETIGYLEIPEEYDTKNTYAAITTVLLKEVTGQHALYMEFLGEGYQIDTWYFE